MLGSAFLVGWLLGLIVAVSVFSALADVVPEWGSDGSQPVIGVIKLVIGVLLLLLSARRRRSRPGVLPPEGSAAGGQSVLLR